MNSSSPYVLVPREPSDEMLLAAWMADGGSVETTDWEALIGEYRLMWSAMLAASETTCEDCPPVGYPTDKTRCLPCPRRASPEAEGGGWRDIASAPRDGTPILIHRAGASFIVEDGWHVVRWNDDWWQVHCGKNDHPLRGIDPTHWRPLDVPDATREAERSPLPTEGDESREQASTLQGGN